MSSGFYGRPGSFFGRYPTSGRRTQNRGYFTGQQAGGMRQVREQSAENEHTEQQAPAGSGSIEPGVLEKIEHSDAVYTAEPQSGPVSDTEPETEYEDEQIEQASDESEPTEYSEPEKAEQVEVVYAAEQQTIDTTDAAQDPEQEEDQTEEEHAYRIGNTDLQELTISLPGGVVPVLLFVTPYPKGSAEYNAESAELIIKETGFYRMDVTLRINSPAAEPAAFIVQVNGKTLPGGVFTVMLSEGDQVLSGSVEAPLSEGDAARLVFTSMSPLRIELGGSDIPAELSIKRDMES